MGGRNAKPVDLHIAEGNPNRLTKEQIANRKKAEVKMGTTDLSKIRAPSHITKDKIAHKEWQKLLKEYKRAAEQGVELLTNSDVGMLALYCKTYSEYEHLITARQRIENIAIDSDSLEDYLRDNEDFDYEARKRLTHVISVDGILKIETAVNKKMDMLIKMQDRLFLNPLAKVKNIPKPKKEEKPKSKFDKFKRGG